MHAYVRFVEDGQRIILPVTSIKKFDATKHSDPLQKYRMKWTDDSYYEGTIIFTAASYQAAEERLERKRAVIPNRVLPLKSCSDSTDDNMDDVTQPSQPNVKAQTLAAMERKLGKLTRCDSKKLEENNSHDRLDATVSVKTEKKSPHQTPGKGAIPKKKMPAKKSDQTIGPKISATAGKGIEKQNTKIPEKKLLQKKLVVTGDSSTTAEEVLRKEDTEIYRLKSCQKKSDTTLKPSVSSEKNGIEIQNAKIRGNKPSQEQPDVVLKPSASEEKEIEIEREGVTSVETKSSQKKLDVTSKRNATAEKGVPQKGSAVFAKNMSQKKDKNSGPGITEQKDAQIKELNLKVDNLQRVLKDKQLLIQQLTRLNIDLQKTVIDGFGTVKATIGDLCGLKAFAQQPEVDIAGGLYPVGYQRQIDEMIHLGRDVWIPGTSWHTILSKSSTPSLFVKYMAVAVFGTEVLKMSSVTGAVCNRKKKDGVVAKPALDARKLSAIRDIFRYWLTNEKKLDDVSVDIHLRDTGTFIGRKIADLIRPKNDDVQPAVADFVDASVMNDDDGEKSLDASIRSEEEPEGVDDMDETVYSPPFSPENSGDFET